MRIQHNIPAMSSYRNYTRNVSAVNKNLEKLSSGYRINRAGDDAAGLAISEKMRLQISGLEQAQNNAKSGINLVQTAEGALTEVHDMLNRMYTLAEQSANGTYSNEVDREQLQKEVNSLRTEINRIADATNYNGINLLDGKLGLNSDAFEIGFGAAAAVEASDGNFTGADLVGDISAANAHFEVAAGDGGAAKFTVDFKGVSVKGAKADGSAGAPGKTLKDAGKVTVSFGDVKIDDVTFTQGTASGKTVKVDGTDNTNGIATAVLNSLKASSFKVDTSDGKSTNYDGIWVTGASGTKYAFKMTDGTGKIDFELAGVMGADNKYSTDVTNLTEDQLKEVNGLIGTGVKIEVKAPTLADDEDVVSSLTIGSQQIHDTTKVTYAQAKQDAGFAGVDITLNESLMEDGATLTIDGVTLEFKVSADHTTDAANTEIDLTGFKGDKEDKTALLHYAIDKLSNQNAIAGKDAEGTANGRSWTISSAGDNKIHIDQTVATTAAATDATKAIDSSEKLLALISAKGKAVNAANVGTTIKIDDAKVKEGDTLNIDGKTYTFSDKKTGDGYVAIKGGAGQNLANAISGSEFKDGVLTVRAKNADDAAPAVLGKGLSLQIGDTADEFNKMTVSVRDMHAISMGIGDIDISTQEGASEAMAKIQAATNYVSDARGDLGALQNRLDHTINNLSVTQENIQDAESTIRDVDIAKEMMAYTKNNILVQSAQAMLAQANQLPQGVLQLLG